MAGSPSCIRIRWRPGRACIAWRSGETPEDRPESGVLRFHNPHHYSNYFLDAGNLRLRAPYHHGTWNIRFQPGQLVLFPSWLQHEVMPFYGNDERITSRVQLLVRNEGCLIASAARTADERRSEELDSRANLPAFVEALVAEEQRCVCCLNSARRSAFSGTSRVLRAMAAGVPRTAATLPCGP